MSTTKNNLRFKQPLKNAVVKVKEPLTQQKLDNGLELKDAPQPVLNKIKSEVKIIGKNNFYFPPYLFML